MKKWKLFAGITLVFALGVIAGALGMGLYFKQQMLPFKGDPKARKAFLMERLSKRLDLTANQKIKFEKIVDELEAKRQEYRSELRKIRAEAISQMKKDLMPDQQKKLDQLHQEFERYRKKKETRKW